MQKERHFIMYRMKDKDNVVLYVGQTVQSLDKRIKQHFSDRGYIKSYLDKIETVEYSEVNTGADLNIYEAYYIAWQKPKLNGQLMVFDCPTIKIPELKFEIYEGFIDIKEKILDTRQRKFNKETEDFIKRYNLTPEEEVDYRKWRKDSNRPSVIYYEQFLKRKKREDEFDNLF